MDAAEDLHVEADEPPDERTPRSTRTPCKPHAYNKADPAIYNRRESLLTRQLHSETEHTDEEDASHAPPRTLSTQSTWSNPSTVSTAELTSDDGHSVASPAISPPLPPTAIRGALPIIEKPLAREPQILEQEDRVASPEQSVEAGLGRKRCISFACGDKDKNAPISQPGPLPGATTTKEFKHQNDPTSPPKRKCALKFVCPTRNSADKQAVNRPVSIAKRPASPPPPQRRASANPDAIKAHRGSDSTVTHVSPISTRRTPEMTTTVATPAVEIKASTFQRKMSNESHSSTEATRFHEFASSEDEPEEWVQESTCYKSRLTVSDTLQKENIIRKACQEVEEEVIEEEELEDELDDDDDDDDDADEDDEDADGDEEEEEEVSDDGFRTDDEEGFAESDTEGEESDEEWWRPGGGLTAATSIDHLERMTFNKKDDAVLASSVGSHSSGHITRPTKVKIHRKRRSHGTGLTIGGRADPVDLPDSTDFVCGTLDEDRPIEQAYLNTLKAKEAAKHKARPQDIDPTFPTSDPEMDEEDDEDLEDPEDSEDENLMHGEIDEFDGDFTARPSRPRTKSNAHSSPLPPARRRSPAPGMLKHQSTARSPPPPVRRNTARSPPPPARRGTARSPAPAKLFTHSPKRSRSPAPAMKMTSPPNTRRASPNHSVIGQNTTHVLASRPQLTHTASLPRGGFMMGKLNSLAISGHEGSDTECNVTVGEVSRRGAIDIFKGLEKKRQRRKEKLYQKACAKAAAKGEKAYKVKPGKGAERMREVGLQLQEYHGKGGKHILSL
ncbi:hypothetical protein DOTSEDRAFT_67865 [Dothistroma septosporum NZE10]|uniref:Extensin domain-containing protein n=1 Tax=Dothistroma septosporum (strain NZE10 / CBS 128990) TaxID=675120 RepID=N1PZV2_DOTSN|nr:hypothetical protein DOTSEDRAFT_67865 [Dothistroma septosporum NZE10]